MTILVASSAGMALGGPFLALVFALTAVLVSMRRRPGPDPPIRPVLLVLLVELRTGSSILASLQRAADIFPDHRELVRAVRVASVNGLTAAIEIASGDVRKLLSHLARSQRSGSPAGRTVRSLLDADIAAERAARLSRAKSLPVKLMIPVSLLLLPGLILLVYAPGLLRLLGDLTEAF